MIPGSQAGHSEIVEDTTSEQDNMTRADLRYSPIAGYNYVLAKNCTKRYWVYKTGSPP